MLLCYTAINKSNEQWSGDWSRSKRVISNLFGVWQSTRLHLEQHLIWKHSMNNEALNENKDFRQARLIEYSKSIKNKILLSIIFRHFSTYYRL